MGVEKAMVQVRDASGCITGWALRTNPVTAAALRSGNGVAAQAAQDVQANFVALEARVAAAELMILDLQNLLAAQNKEIDDLTKRVFVLEHPDIPTPKAGRTGGGRHGSDS